MANITMGMSPARFQHAEGRNTLEGGGLYVRKLKTILEPGFSTKQDAYESLAAEIHCGSLSYGRYLGQERLISDGAVLLFLSKYILSVSFEQTAALSFVT
ncbi:uncharacterized protein QC763_0037880 [Podospora pseudopauciseta]|uniref:Uncharacterized protein n=1 Tax=Podospora pseudopauciseta TaxID=2093780 RepID=A0ABR0HPC2_9PEZI|nr:hypothetical protein QC763_0037880 [Podospora pseudopauciseta]